MKNNTKPISQWTKEECFAEVERLGCKTRKDITKYGGLYKKMRKEGWMNEYFGEKLSGKTTNPICGWSKDECFAECDRLGYKTHKDIKSNSAIYKRMRETGWLYEYLGISKKNKPITNLSKEECFAECDRLGCKTRKELVKKWSALYLKMNECGWLDEYFGEKNILNVSHWSKDECFKACNEKGYKTVSELQDGWNILYVTMLKNGWIKEYPWESYLNHMPFTIVINSFVKNIDFWESLTITEILCIASAFGELSAMGKFLKKLARSNANTKERKFSLKSIAEMGEKGEDEAMKELNEEEQNDSVKESDNINDMVDTAENMPSSEKEYQEELERVAKVMKGIEKLNDNKELMEIINSGNVIETLKNSIINRITIMSFEHPQIFDELSEKYC